MNWRATIHRASRNRKVLSLMVCGILLVALVIAEVLYRVNKRNLTDEEQIAQLFFQAHEEQAVDSLSAYLGSTNFSYSALLDMASYFASLERDSLKVQVKTAIQSSPLPPQHAQWFLQYMNALSINTDSLPESLLREAEQGTRWSNRIVGDFASENRQTEEAAKAYEKEGTFEDAEVSRERHIYALIRLKKLNALTQLEKLPLYEKLFDDHLRFTLAIYERDWKEIVLRLPAAQYGGIQWGTALQAITVALVWLLLLLQLGQCPKGFSVTLGLSLVGLILGALSTMPTILAVILEEDFLGFEMRYDLVGGLVYCIGGIGLREELIKLLFVFPLVPFLTRRNNPLEMLLVSSCVGLGFAVEENVQYFQQSFNTAVSARFLTANFLHLATTGLSGYALCAAWRNPRFWDEFFTVFGIVVVLHGLYDAFIMVPDLAGYSLFSMTVFVLLAYRYFGVLHSIREVCSDPLSLTGHFLLGLSVISAINILYLGKFAGALVALNILGGSIIGLGVIVYMFIREFREHIE